MATYYVRSTGNDGNTGLGPGTGQAWATIGKALGATGITGGDTVYIAPGTYREVVTIGGTYASATYIYGDPTASLFSGVTAGEVRITPSGSDNAVSTSYALTATSKNNLNFRDLIIGGMIFTSCTNTVVERCLCFSTSATTEAFYFIAGTTANFNTTLKQSVFVGTAYGIRYAFNNSGSQYTTGLAVTDCYISGNSAVWLNGAGNFSPFPAGGMTFYNCVMSGYIPFLFSSGGLTGPSTGNNIAVYNSLIYATGTYAFQNANSSVGITENYNRVYGVNTRISVSQGANTTVASWSGLEFGQSLLQGFGPLQIFGNTFNSPNATAGTASGAPTVDMYNQSWNVTPDIGVAIYRNIGGVGPYLPSERNASTITIAPGSTSQSIEVYLGATGLTASTAGLSAHYNRTRTASVNIPLIARTIGQAWISGGFAEVDAVNMPGIYRVDIPDAALAVGADDVTLVVRGASGTNGAVMTIKLSSGGLTSAETASAVWGASVAGYVTATDFGGVINETRNVVGATEAYVLDVPNQVWEELTVNHDTHGTYGWNVLRADAPSKEGIVTLHQSGGISRVDADIHAIVNDADAASELKGALLHNGTDYISANLLTPTSPATLLRMGPYSVVADQAKQEINIDILTGSSLPVVLQLVDVTGTGIPLVGATLSVKIYNASGTLVTTYSGTASYSDAGFLTFTLDSVVTATPGTYYLTVTRTTGATDTSIYGGLRLYVRSN